MQRYTRYLMLMAALLPLAACSANWDMNGTDPKDYYAEHPIQNKVETREEVALVRFPSHDTKLTADETDKLQDQLRSLSMAAVESIHISSSDIDYSRDARQDSLVRVLRRMGYTGHRYTFEKSSTLPRDTLQIDIQYAAVVSPDCPDWRTSPVTTYSNTAQGNFGCAQEVDLGLMVADPRDLVHGTGNIPLDTERASKAIQDYHTGAAAASASSAPSSGSGATASGNGGGSSTTGGTGQ